MPLGQLYIVATPIGNLEDLGSRALATLRGADFILCEDTRVSRKMLEHYKIKKELISFHQHSRENKYERIISLLAEGKNLALITDAGTPGIADPGGELVESVSQALPEVKIAPIPGPSAMLAALSVSGFNTQEFVFLGWPPHKKGRETWFKELAEERRVVVFYESVYRVKNALERIGLVCPARPIILARELTKMFETIYRGNAESVLDALEKDKVKGEFVAVLDRN